MRAKDKEFGQNMQPSSGDKEGVLGHWAVFKELVTRVWLRGDLGPLLPAGCPAQPCPAERTRGLREGK